MFRSLRARLILSHVLPVLLILPLLGLALVYTLEREVFIPQLANNLLGQARMLAEISSVEFELWGDPILFTSMVDRVKIDPAIRVTFLSPDGRLLFSSDPADAPIRGQTQAVNGLEKAQKGEETALTNYSFFRLNNVSVDVLEPVTDASQRVFGIVRVTYQVTSLSELFGRVRLLVIAVMAAALLITALLGAGLAITISRPVQRVTQAIYSLAAGDPAMQGEDHQLLEDIGGPEELRKQVQAVNFLVEQLHGLEQARRQLLANLVHEIGRPLGALRSAIHALSSGAAQDPKLLADLTQGMDAETRRMEHLLDDLARLYDKVLGSLELNLQPVSPAEWLPGVLRPWKAAADEKHLSWQQDIPGDLPSFSADPVRLAQVVGNLLNNAVKYTPAGGSIKIAAGVTPPDGENAAQFYLSVSDSGAGIAPAEQEKIFTPFYRGDQGRRIKQGMGLGLSIARDLAVAHGGRIELASQPGQGSTFTLYIPL